MKSEHYKIIIQTEWQTIEINWKTVIDDDKKFKYHIEKVMVEDRVSPFAVNERKFTDRFLEPLEDLFYNLYKNGEVEYYYNDFYMGLGSYNMNLKTSPPAHITWKEVE